MPDPIKIRAQLAGDTLDLRVMMPHPMESGQRRDAQTGKLIPAHYIERATIALNGRSVIELELGTAVASNPVFGFKLRGATGGDKVSVSWQDNKGEKRADETVVSYAARS